MEGKNSYTCYANRKPVLGFLFAFFFGMGLPSNLLYSKPGKAQSGFYKSVTVPPDSTKLKEIKSGFVKAGSVIKAKFHQVGNEVKQVAESPKADSVKLKTKNAWKKVVSKSRAVVSGI